MIIGIDMGHSISGPGSGAVGIVKETDKNREVGKRLISILREKGHTVIDCSVDSASSTDNQLYGIVQKANAQKLDLFVSLHLNSFNGAAYGVETFVYSLGSSVKSKAEAVQNELVNTIGWYNRGLKTANYYVLRKTTAPAMLVELGFCDSQKDMNLWNTDKIAKALFKGITGVDYIAVAPSIPSTPNTSTSQDWNNTEIKRYAENGKCYVKTTLNFRDKPSTKTGAVQGQYYNNESVNYDLVVITNKYVWISWISRTGNRRYMAIKDRTTNERWGNCV